MEIRSAIKDNPFLQEALKDSMSDPIRLVCGRFCVMKIKDQLIDIGFPANDEQIKDMLEYLRFIEPKVTSVENLSSKMIKESDVLRKFMDTHCHMSNYVFQVKKCLSSECFYCTRYPVRMSIDKFQSLSYLPLPILDAMKEHYGQIPSDKCQPSKGPLCFQEGREIDKSRSKLFVNSKVRRIIVCQECFKPRCIFSLRKLTTDEIAHIERIDDSRLYNCGSPLFPPSSSYYDTIVVRVGLSCADPVEVQYYSATLISFPQVCYYCGISQEALLENDQIRELRKQYAVVRPICFICYSSGKRPATRQCNNMAKNPKRPKLDL